MIRAIFFDFNGVVIDDERLQLEAYREALGAEDITLTDEDYFGCLGMDDRTFVRAAFERAGLEVADEKMSAIIERKTELHRELIKDDLPLFHGVVTFIKNSSRHYALGLVSMARLVEISHVLERARLDNVFSVIVSAEDVKACKPDPSCYLLALERLNEKRRAAGEPLVQAAECLVIEDSPPGIESGRAAGMRTLGVTNTVTEAELRAARADVVTANLYDWNADAVHHVFN
ncbi:MAG TPA: HAD family phosphatase [Pyrinomonadaceae bacterium]|nr:HAD family phosphatase [Pyrinomonadaceae bacterium]